jgi:hypothetical protein
MQTFQSIQAASSSVDSAGGLIGVLLSATSLIAQFDPLQPLRFAESGRSDVENGCSTPALTRDARASAQRRVQRLVRLQSAHGQLPQ